MDEKRMARLFGLTLGGLFAISLIPKCNRHLEWDETGRLRPCQKVAHWLGVLTPRALSVSAIRWRERWRRALLHAPGRQSGLSRCRIILDPVDRLPSETSGSCDLANA